MLWSTHQLCIIHRAPSQTGEEVMLSHMASCAGKVKRERERFSGDSLAAQREKKERERGREGMRDSTVGNHCPSSYWRFSLT